jgi:hypothetical protein
VHEGPTIRETANRKLARRVRDVFQSSVRLPFSYHEMDDYQSLEYNGPCRIPDPVFQGSKDLRDASFPTAGCQKDMFDILGLGGSKL